MSAPGALDRRVDDCARVDAYSTGSLSYTSSVKDAGVSVTWTTLSALSNVPTGTSLTFQTRTSPDTATWSAWTALGTGGTIASPAGRYIQYQATLATTSTQVSPDLDQVTLAHQ